MHQQNPNPMEWHYYTNKATKRKIDHLLQEAAMLFANCEPTYQSRQEALKQEQEILKQIHALDPHFAERCGYNPWCRESTLTKRLLRIQALDSA